MATGLAVALTATVASVSSPAAAAPALPADRLTVTAGGSADYRLQADVTAGGISVTDAVFDYATEAIRGRATLPGVNGGQATVDVRITRGLDLTGTFTLRDPRAGVTISATVSAGVRRTADDTVTWQGTGTVERQGARTSQPVSFTVQDRRLDPGNHAVRLTHAGQLRSAILRLPDDHDGSPRPTVLHFPGLFETPWIAEYHGRMADHAQKNGYIMVTPEHYGPGWQGVPGGAESPDVDDPGFVRALLDVLVRRFNADPTRLYASGMSNGGFFTQKLACELGDRFAAFAAVAGQMWDTGPCHPSRPVPMLMIHGDADPLVPYGTATTTAAFWARANGCAATTTDTVLPDRDPSDTTTVVRRVYQDCPAATPVVLDQIRNGGHHWPGGTPYPVSMLGATTYDISANQVIWDFVSRFRLPD